MKKTLIALAVLAAGSAFAQSNVNLYGRVEVGYAKTTNVPAGMVSGFNSPTIFGLKGSEDLGGKLKANFNLETGGVDATTGGSGINFSRAAWVGLSGDFGAVQLGRQASLGNVAMGRFDLNGTSDASALGLASVSPVLWYGSSRRDAQIVYTTPSFSGFDAALSYVASGNDNTYGLTKSRTALRLNYGNGPLAVGFAAESGYADTNRAAYALAGSYDFGAAKVAGGWVRSENKHAAYLQPANNTAMPNAALGGGQGYFLGVSAPFGATTVGAQFANNTADSAKALELFANYNLSKRTVLFVDAARLQVSGNGDMNRYAFGLQHNF